MITADGLSPDQLAPDAASDTRLTTWYAQGHSDGLGDRLLMFDNTNAPSWEILRFKPSLTREPRFEAALRERVERLSTFQHDSFPLVRPIKQLGHDEGLAVVSTYSGGATLSEALKRPRSAEFALRLIRQLVPALAALQELAPGVAHGAITVDRIILSADGRLMIREHMLGAAIESLEWTAVRLWSELGIMVPRAPGAIRIDERTDIAQLALVVVSLMAGRRIGPDEYPDRTSELLDDLTLRNHWHNPTNPAKFQSLRHWLERALQLTGQSFSSAHDALVALAELQDPGEAKANRSDDTQRIDTQRISAVRSLPGTASQPPRPPAQALKPSPASGPETNEGSAAGRGWFAAWRGRSTKTWRGVPPPVMRWLTVTLAVLVIAEAVFIGRLLWTQSPGSPVETKTAASSPPATPAPRLQTSEQPSPVAALPPVVAATTARVDPKVPEVRELQAPTAVRTGGVRVSAPIELHVLDGERVIGSSVDGPIVVTAGRREFDFVNSAIGYRVRQAVDVKAGEIVSVTVPVPNGTLNINAQPWAAVWLDGNSVGETPLGDLSVVPGEHEILFRHPQLGERRERAIVRSGVETRVAVNLRK